MFHSTPKQLCFPPVAGQTIRADFEGGALSSDFGALLLRGVDRQVGLTDRLAAAIHDKRFVESLEPYGQNIRTRLPTGGYASYHRSTLACLLFPYHRYSSAIGTGKAVGRDDGLETSAGVY